MSWKDKYTLADRLNGALKAKVHTLLAALLSPAPS